MKKEDSLLWGLVVSFIFAVALNWPAPLRILVIALSLGVLYQTALRLYRAYFPRP